MFDDLLPESFKKIATNGMVGKSFVDFNSNVLGTQLNLTNKCLLRWRCKLIFEDVDEALIHYTNTYNLS